MKNIAYLENHYQITYAHKIHGEEISTNKIDLLIACSIKKMKYEIEDIHAHASGIIISKFKEKKKDKMLNWQD